MPGVVSFRGSPNRKSAAAFPEIAPVKLNRPREAFWPWLPVVRRKNSAPVEMLCAPRV